MKDFSGKVAVVTGGASGIGRAMAERFAREGMKIVLADVEQAALKQAETEMRAAGATVISVPTDVSKLEQVQALAQRTLREFSQVDIICNNAGVAALGMPSWGAPIQDWQWVLGVNLWGVIHGVHTFVPIMLQQGTEAHVVNTASLAGLMSGPMMATYGVAKFGVVALSEALHHELTLQGASVKVSVLCPAWVNTRIADAERNRPADLQRETEQPPAPLESVVRQLLATGLSPENVAEQVLDAVKNDRFYIITHPETKAIIRQRMENILEGENPVFSGFNITQEQ